MRIASAITPPPARLGCIGLALFLLLPAAHAQLFKWVDENGKVHYTDKPPPANAKLQKTLSNSGGAESGAGLPFELAEAVRNHPVTLYTTDKCPPCDDARALLRTRGVPYSEKTVNSYEDQVKLREVNGDLQLPVLVVGRNKQRGYEPNAWHSALSAAAYPEASILPSNYQFRAAEPAAPPPPAKAVANNNAQPAQPAPEKTPDALPPPTGNAPPGFRF